MLSYDNVKACVISSLVDEKHALWMHSYPGHINSTCNANKMLKATRNTFCRTWSPSNATFSFLITWRSCSSKSADVYKISSKADDFSPRYGNITIFKMAAVRHLGIVLPPYETTHEVSVAGRSCLSNFRSIWYRSADIAVWIFCIFGLKCPFRHPKWGFCLTTAQFPTSLLYQQEVKVIWQKAPHGGPIPRLGVTPGVESCTTEFLG